MASPRVKISLKTKNNFKEHANQYVGIAALWDGDYDLSGSFSDGRWIPDNGFGYRVDSISMTVDGNKVTVDPRTVYLNGKVENETVSLWVKSKDSGKTVNLATLTEGEYGLSGSFSGSVDAINVSVVSSDASEMQVSIKPDDCFLNGYLNEPSSEAAVQPNEKVIAAAAAAADDIPF